MTPPETDLEPGESWFRTLAETSSFAIFVYRERFLYANPAAKKLMGMSLSELRELKFWEAVHPDHRELVRQRGEARLQGEEVPTRYEFKIQRKDGESRWVDFTAGRIDFHGAPAGLGTAVDVTERKEAEEALHREKELAQITLESIGDGVIRTDDRGRIDYLNPVAEELTGWSEEEAEGKRLREVLKIVDEATGVPVENPVEHSLRDGRIGVFPGDRVLVSRDGGRARVRDLAAPIRDREGEIAGAVLVLRDLSRLRELEEEMDQLATRDPVTGLINRREFERRLVGAIDEVEAGGAGHALAYLDLDQFKLVNDTCGHTAGDELIKQIGELIRTVVGEDRTLARLGGDEFGLLLRSTTTSEARDLAEGIVEAVREFRFSWEDRLFAVGVSVGLVPIDEETREADSALSAADAACYVAKEQGGNRVHLHRPDDTALAQRYGEMQWVSRIHRALAEDRLVLFRQEIRPVDPSRSEDPLYEVFLRLREPGGELIGPEAFIPAAERYKLIGRLDRWVLRRTLELVARIREEGDRRTRFAVNISGQSLGDEAFLSFAVDEVERSGIPGDRLCFEITETAAVARLTKALRFMSVFQRMGCRFSLDDFGTGVSSFAYLRNLPVDYVKIDGEFVRDMTRDPIQQALVQSVNGIAHTMGVETVAESVEDEATLESLRDLGVDLAQGYWIDRPRMLEEPGAARARTGSE